jgi:hypothetical protein
MHHAECQNNGSEIADQISSLLSHRLLIFGFTPATVVVFALEPQVADNTSKI